MIKKDLTTVTINREPRVTRTEEWSLMPIGTTFIHPKDNHLCLKVSDEIMFDLENREDIYVEEEKQAIWDYSREDPIEIKFELVDISITVKTK